MSSVTASSGCVRAQRQAFGTLPGLTRQSKHTSLSSRTHISRPAIVAAPAQRAVKVQVAQEAFQMADAASFISGTAATVFAMTLVGLAIGFVLLRFEALVEEGKIV